MLFQSTYTDKELLQQTADDSMAFTMLHRRYWGELFVISAKVLRGKTESEDVAQDIFLSLRNRAL